MTSRYFDEEEVEDLVHYISVAVHEETIDTRRWHDLVETVVRADDDKLYRLSWKRGLTEDQDHEYIGGEYPEVFEHREVRAKSIVDYLTADELKNRQSEDDDINADIESLRLVSGDADAVDACFTPEKVTQMRETLVMLDSLEALDPVGSFAEYRVASRHYLEALLKYAEEQE